jgi:cellulose synthase/poly-beta-1,6-N-acetylglucosamine synthase-like glycosyltransferase
MAGVDGAMFACRKELIDPLPKHIILDDFLIAMRVVAKGYKIRYAATARADEWIPASVRQELRRKSRIAAGAFQVLPQMLFLLRFWKYPAVTLFVLSHKLLRWYTPLLILATFFSSLILSDEPFYLAAFLAQLAVLLLAALGASVAKARSIGIVYIPYYFCSINIAYLIGMYRCLAGSQPVTWDRVNREQVSSNR